MPIDEIVAIVVSLAVTSVFGGFIVYLKKTLKKLNAAQEGIKAILYDNIVNTYNKYKGGSGQAPFIPIYARKTLDAVHGAYKKMDGNGTAHSLYEKMMSWSTDKIEE